ncbi:hypothetical protein LOC71_11560 [Rhodopirellula sp. JC740]|jgi:hypothetical protein|uniref:Uncharacterized protein n=1 Tax=Rhodopirellula halodulae TaxID=2894198 RepID=A0ABS8NH92_9BACT|nr:MULTISPECIES: hypothetical protein [unclassified Rhodopirellula]MCC9642915.1 hypothetical protein [Rhodopirellula sp. JC740]MCH1494269.1 hypothetical protein [Rubripirellula sp.]
MSDARRSNIAAILSRALTRCRTKAEQSATQCAIYTRQSNQVDVEQDSELIDNNELAIVPEAEKANTEVSR